MVYAVALIVIFLAICGIVKAVDSDRYRNMTEEEFEEEAKRSSRATGMVSALQKIIDPSHRVEYVQEQKQRIEADGAESGDPPNPDGPTQIPKS